MVIREFVDLARLGAQHSDQVFGIGSG